MEKRLYRSQKEKIIAGICGGFGEFFGIDPTVVRILFILFIFAGGSGILLYLLLWLVIPKADQQEGFITRETMKNFAKEIQESAQNVKDALKANKDEKKEEARTSENKSSENKN